MELLLAASWCIIGGVIILAGLVIVVLRWDDQEVDNLFEEPPTKKK